MDDLTALGGAELLATPIAGLGDGLDEGTLTGVASMAGKTREDAIEAV